MSLTKRSITDVPSKSRRNVITTGCDICWGKNHFAGMKLQKCRICNVHVHPQCYGHYPPNGESEDEYYEKQFECWACRAVGKEVHGRQLLTGVPKTMVVRERPTECCLCGAENGMEFLHAMHPIYDYHGKSGRQVILPASKEGPERLAWAHSLCCFALCSHSQTSGCVYGCNMDGAYEGDAAKEPEDSMADKNDTNPDLVRIDAILGGKESIHHFAYWGIRKGEEDTPDPWTRTIREHQALKCRLCGKDDRPSYVLRIPVQCSANSPSEFEEFAGKHIHLGDDTCYEAIHVGCAIWKKNDAGAWPTRRRVYFHPGSSQGDLQIDPVINVFCTAHAHDLSGVGGGKLLRYPESVHHPEIPQMAAVGRTGSLGTVPKSSPILQRTIHQPKRVNGEMHKRSASLSALPRSRNNSIDQERSTKRRSTLQESPSLAQTRKVPEKSTVVGWPSNPKPKPSDEHGPEEKDGEDSDRDPTGPTNSFLADNTTPEKGLGLIPRKVAVAHSFESEPQKKQKATASSPPKPKNSGPSEPTKALQSDNCVDAILDHVPRKRPAVGPSNGEPKKKQELPTKANQKNDTGNSKKGGRVRDLVTVAGENPLSPQARLKPGKKKKSTEGEQRKKKNLGKKNMGDPAGQSRPSSATIPMKRKISESKCHAYDDTELERKYLMIVESFKEVVEKFVYSKETLTEVMEEKKPTWEKKINAPGRVFNALWSKVESGLSKNVDFSGEDWSFLVVGKNFDLGKVDFSQWDSCEVIDDDSDGMSV